MLYNHPTMFITAEEYKEHLYNINLESHSDYQFVLEAWLKDSNNFFYINKVLSNFRLGGISGNMPFFKRLKEGYMARKYAGLPIIKNIISYNFRLMVFTINKIKTKLK